MAGVVQGNGTIHLRGATTALCRWRMTIDIKVSSARQIPSNVMTRFDLSWPQLERKMIEAGKDKQGGEVRSWRGVPRIDRTLCW